MRILVVAEHDTTTIRPGTRSAVGFANSVAASTGGEVECLVLGHEIDSVAREAALISRVLSADSPALADPVADRYAKVIADVVSDRNTDLVVAASTSFAKDVVGRAAGLLGGAMASDVVGHSLHDGQLVMRRPMFAGAVTATVMLTGCPQIVTIRASAYEAPQPTDVALEITAINIDESTLPSHIHFECVDSKSSHRPDVTDARIVVSGGRAIKNLEDYECLVGGLADQLGGATGSSRALVDAGITTNDLQVGQTGKIVAPDLYFALGISGAVQHLAGMKNSKVIVAINNDPDAPIFEMADYGLVGDVYELVPQLIQRLDAR
ncbi:MAG: electron transfer flavoprotein subunit alpha/FixB family protein [Pirellulaceae bacterium]|jgi:electron transfer flavoprotein alpha subunit|nr:electron transfer flavoprotein subunit alpha/FixB family protein [Pirellulaceae bacterium]